MSCNKNSSAPVMDCLHGKAGSYNFERFCVESCNGCQVGHSSQRQHDCLVMNENELWQLYGLQAIKRVNGKHVVWIEFAEAMRVQQLEKDPDSTFGDSLMELHQNTEKQELQCILKYLFH